MNNRLLLVTAILIVVAWMVFRSCENYVSGRAAYRYGFVDTNPARGFLMRSIPLNAVMSTKVSLCPK